MTTPHRYPLHNIADFTSRISGFTVFSKLDLQKGYYQVPVASKDIQKTEIITPFVMFDFLCMPFCLRIAGNTFQGMMDLDLGELPSCFVYLDDILIFSKDLSWHVGNLREVFASIGNMTSQLASLSVNLKSPRSSLMAIFSLPLVVCPW